MAIEFSPVDPRAGRASLARRAFIEVRRLGTVMRRLTDDKMAHYRKPFAHARERTASVSSSACRPQTEVIVKGLHTLQEDTHDEIGAAIADFVRRLRGSARS